ncbi:MAG: hypothetical protein KKF98_07235 [Bacteroidetes bacterium]|nr:hypothetical protein [Bacteroidota bacterium]
MKKSTLLLSILITLTISCFGQIDENLSYEELETKAISSFRNNHTDSSINIMEYAHKKFPEEFARTSNILAYIYTRTNNLSKAIEIWRIGINKGYMYDLNNPYYQDYYKDNADFEALAQIEKSRLDTMHVKYEIALPADYNNKKTYPILFVFHGNNRNIEKSKISWNAPIMKKEFITVFLQSYIPSSPTDFKWVSKDEKIKNEFNDIYDQVLTNYPVDESKIIFAGMSAGGKKALDFTLNNYFPVSGLVLNCPVIPENVTDEMTKQFVEKNKKLGIITGENDFALEGQKKLVSTIDSLGGQTKMFITKDLGHSFAENFTEILDEYLSWVIESEQNFLESKNAYFDQNPPGDSAVIFAPGIFSLPNRLESNIAFTPDGKACYFGVLEIKDRKVSCKIFQSTFANNKWSEQTEAPFSLNHNIGDPVLSADGKKLYFNKEGDIWMVERTSGKWGAAQKLPAPINSDANEVSITESADGDIVISSRRPGGFGGIDIWGINRLADQSLQAENFGPTINSMYFDYSPFIAPDGSYLIFGSYRARRDGLLYISFNEGDDIWTTPINMNSCGAHVNNTTAHHSNPSLSPDGKYLFFRRHEADTVMDVYWVSTEILKPLKEKALQKHSSRKFANLKGDYLGQTPPGEIPVVFAPGIVSTDTTIEHGWPTFSPDGNEVYWQSNYRQKGEETQIFGITMQRFKNTWHAPTISPNISGPAFSPDGNRLYFLPFGEKNGEKNGPYYVEREGYQWSRPVCMDLIKNFPEIKYAYNYSVTSNGTFYFIGHAESVGSMNDFGIYRMELNNDEYSKPELLPANINMGDGLLNWTPFIAPDESYLLFSSNRLSPETDMGDIYISFRDSEGNWTDPVNLGDEVNSDRQERFPSVSPDGKYLFFTRWVVRGNEDVLWVSADIIEKLRKKNIEK